jgi:3-phosphoshikimate 1-carboxyvinyltransferase
MMRKGHARRALTGVLRVPGDKSISHRALVLAAMSDSPSRITNLNTGADVAATASCLRALGAEIERDGTSASVTPHPWREPTQILDCGNSGTTIRLLMGPLAGMEGLSILTGDETLKRRPMLRVVAPLREMGATIDGRRYGEFAPLTIRGGDLIPVVKELPIASAQVKSALLFAGMHANGTTSVIEPGPSRDHTERMTAALGAPITTGGREVSIEGPWRPSGFEVEVPGDPSSAAYLLVAALITPGSELSIEGLGLNPTRIGAFEVLVSMGAKLRWEQTADMLGEPVGVVTAAYSELSGIEVGGADLIPRLIDEIPILAVAAAFAQGTTTFRGVGELKVKESDRLTALASGLRDVGIEAEASSDSLMVAGGDIEGGEVDSLGDHRIALAFAVAGSLAPERLRIQRWSAVETSFPEFAALLDQARSKR